MRWKIKPKPVPPMEWDVRYRRVFAWWPRKCEDTGEKVWLETVIEWQWYVKRMSSYARINAVWETAGYSKDAGADDDQLEAKRRKMQNVVWRAYPVNSSMTAVERLAAGSTVPVLPMTQYGKPEGVA